MNRPLRPLSAVSTLGPLLLLVGCASATPKGEAIKIREVLTQVKSAVEQAASESHLATIKITSVELNLQLGVDADAGADYPVGITTLTGDATAEHLNRVSLSFVPTVQPRAPGSVTTEKTSELTKAIKALYEEMPQDDANFKFKRGSIQIQCSFKNEVGIGLKLIPLPFNLQASKDTTQSITLNFSSLDASADSTPTNSDDKKSKLN